MKAIICTNYGSPDVLELREVPKPSLQDNRVLVKIRAASVNIADLYNLQGGLGRLSGGLRKPKDPRVGGDFAGQVEAIGRAVSRFQPGDEVFGTCPGSFAEYGTAREDRIVIKPTQISFEQAAAVPVAAVTALQGLRYSGEVKAGEKILIDGASGGVGTFAIQIAKAFGAEVTAVCSTRSVDVARSIGADHVIDYTHEDFTHQGQQYDLVLGINGNHSIFAYRRVLSPTGIFVMVGASRKSVVRTIIQVALLGPILSRSGGQRFGFMGITKLNQEDLEFIKQLLEAGKVVPVIDRQYPLSQAAEAFRYIAEGHARGKIVVTVNEDHDH